MLLAYLHKTCGGFGFVEDLGDDLRCQYCGEVIPEGSLVTLRGAAEQAVREFLHAASPTSAQLEDESQDNANAPARDLEEALQQVLRRLRVAVRATETAVEKRWARATLELIRRDLAQRGIIIGG